MTEEQVADFLRWEMATWPKVPNDKLAISRAVTLIGRKSRRGFANTVWENFQFYKGLNILDAPCVIGHHNDLYGVVKNPNFDDYGFVIQ